MIALHAARKGLSSRTRLFSRQCPYSISTVINTTQLNSQHDEDLNNDCIETTAPSSFICNHSRFEFSDESRPANIQMTNLEQVDFRHPFVRKYHHDVGARAPNRSSTIIFTNHPLELSQRRIYPSSLLNLTPISRPSHIRQFRYASTKPSSNANIVASKSETQVPDQKEEKISSSPIKSKSETSKKASSLQPNSNSMLRQVQDAIVSASKSLAIFFMKLPGWTLWYMTHPTELRKSLEELWEWIKHEAQHYWMGTKLLYADVQTAWKLLNRTLQGSAMTRRERKQLLRTVSDLFRLVPFSMFVLIPFMEFLLPFALRIFPNMLPSTFQDSLRAEENMKRELQSRLAMASFFQETLHEMAKEQKQIATRKRKEKTASSDGSSSTSSATKEDDSLLEEKEQSAAAMLEFLDSARSGQILPADAIIQFATHFHDDLTLDNMPRMQLMNMCRYMNIPPYGSDNFLRFQLRHKIRSLVEDDQRILWEGIPSLTKMELREACQERGMRSTGLSKDAYKRALREWLDLSVNKNVPISLLIMSRSFFLREEMKTNDASEADKAVAGLADAISGLDDDIVNEVVLKVATPEEKMSDPEIQKIKLEVLEAQNERILEERLERDAKKKKEEKKEKFATDTEESITAETSASDTPMTQMPTREASAEDKPVSDSESSSEKEGLSPGEMDAISQLVNPDPVTREREELMRIKAAMSEEEEEEKLEAIEMGESEKVEEILDEFTAKEPSLTIDDTAAATIAAANQAAEKEAEQSTEIQYETGGPDIESDEEESGEESGDQKLDRAILTLKNRISKMVSKIEVQIDDVESKIGDKLHLLDKDGDGIMSLEEIADAMELVLKRNFSHEEAMAVATLIDENQDGIATLEEFLKWIETNKIIQLLKEGEDGDLDRLLAQHRSERQGKKKPLE
mmetsp:Transcript_406/g.569  ORF Transcript_406/g.569 Transcript_406/m.569 type:complete len:914 (-) Transcript_406:43-2784(-)